MTPLAQAIVADSCLPVRQRRFRDNSGLLPRLLDAHCFDVSAVFRTAIHLSGEMWRSGVTGRGTDTFLPAPLTWIEFQIGRGREGVLLDAPWGAPVASATWARQDGPGCGGRNLFLSAVERGGLILDGNGVLGQEYVYPRVLAAEFRGQRNAWLAGLYVLLAMINSPGVMGRCQHAPHAGLQRRVSAARGSVGKYPLRAWTEIRLEVAAPRPANEHEPIVHLTGGVVFHFVRAHNRTIGDHKVPVKSHWRGDPALGIKRSRYIVVPSRRGPPPPMISP